MFTNVYVLSGNFHPRLSTKMDKTVARSLPDQELVVKRRRVDGSMSVSGGRDLKASQAYPFRFGLEVACQYHHFIEANPTFSPQVLPPFEFDAADSAAMLSTLDWPPGQ
jgi:hypothetical protein